MIYYFAIDDSDSFWHNIKLEAWKEDVDVLYMDNNTKASSFTRIEEIRFFSSHPRSFESTSFKIDFGKNSAVGTSARSSGDLINEIASKSYFGFGPLEQVSKEDYETLREKVFKTFNQSPCMNFDETPKQGDIKIRVYE